MLTIQMPDSHHDKAKRRRLRALGYLTSGLIIMPTLFIAFNTPLWVAVVALETWWIWACLTDPRMKQ